MKIERVLNNNVAVVLNDKRVETIVMGLGIAYNKKPGDTILPEKIEKVFTFTGTEISRFQEVLKGIPSEHIALSEQIINSAKITSGKRFNDIIYITLPDHLSAALDRIAKGIHLTNVLKHDIMQFYPDEYKIGINAVEIIQDETGIAVSNDEAAFIALHFVNAQMDEDFSTIKEMTKLIQEITNTVKYYFQIEYDTELISYFRFVNHLKFFAKRLFSNTAYPEDDFNLLDIIKKEYPNAYNCTKAIEKFIFTTYNYALTKEEMAYMTVHIARIIADLEEKSEE